MIRLEARHDCFALAEPFTISRGTRTHANVVTVRANEIGQGEAVPYPRYNETVEAVLEEIKHVSVKDRLELQEALPAGAARCAIDCALWDLEAKEAGKAAWQLADLIEPKPLPTAYTLSLASVSLMEEAARKNAFRPLLKIKLGNEGDMARLEAVRRGAPNSTLIIDANEGWSIEQYADLAPHLVRLGVAMVEQPLPATEDDALLEVKRPLPVCADESCHTRADLKKMAGKYDMINIKLEKAGGLTEALALKEAAMAAGYKIMVGCMVGSSLSMAPAVLIGQGAEIIDLDGALLLREDRAEKITYDANRIFPAPSRLWG